MLGELERPARPGLVPATASLRGSGTCSAPGGRRSGRPVQLRRPRKGKGAAVEKARRAEARMTARGSRGAQASGTATFSGPAPLRRQRAMVIGAAPAGRGLLGLDVSLAFLRGMPRSELAKLDGEISRNVFLAAPPGGVPRLRALPACAGHDGRNGLGSDSRARPGRGTWRSPRPSPKIGFIRPRLARDVRQARRAGTPPSSSFPRALTTSRELATTKRARLPSSTWSPSSATRSTSPSPSSTAAPRPVNGQAAAYVCADRSMLRY